MFNIGDSVEAQVTVNVRLAPGINTTIMMELQAGETTRIISDAREQDGLIWWPTNAGWIAEVAPDGTRLLAKPSGIHIRLPFDGNYPRTQNFGENPQDYARFGLKGHNAIDFGLSEGTPVFAAADGVVVEVRDDPTGFGFYIKLIHPWGESLYGHLSRQTVQEGQPVKAGQPLGCSGNTGNSTGAHLHFGIRVNPYSRADGWAGYCDPSPYLIEFLAMGTV